MAVPIRMPDLGTTVEEFTLVGWLVEEGSTVERGDLLAEIETDKAVTELESVAKGTLLRQMVRAGEKVYAGDVIAYVGRPGEALPADAAPAEPEVTKAEAVGGAVEAAKARAPGKTQVSPIVRNLAAKLGVDLGQVVGTGRDGVITREDVRRARRAPTGAAQAEEMLPRPQAAVARAVAKAWGEMPHLFITATIDMSAAERIRSQSQAAGKKLGYDAFFLRAMALAIREVPLMAAKLRGESIARPEGVHLAIAVGMDNDLLLPVIRDVDRKGLDALQSEITEVAASVRAGTLKLERMSGACMALSNLGMYPVEAFNPVIFPEHSAILALGAVQKKPVVLADGGLAARPLAAATLAADHRLINGRTAAQFLTKVKEIVESGEME